MIDIDLLSSQNNKAKAMFSYRFIEALNTFIYNKAQKRERNLLKIVDDRR